MGYTHYWEIKADEALDAEVVRYRFRSAASTIKKFAKFVEVQDLFKVKGGFGKGKPIINESEIWLNGDEESGEDCETFSIQWSDFLSDKSGFCKTRRQPYDLIVCFSLLALKQAFKKEFVFFSDGNEDDWLDALKHYSIFTGKKPIAFKS
jgi:hypothetical protein